MIRPSIRTYILLSILLHALILTACESFILKDVPIYHEAKVNGEIFCNAEILFLSGQARCVPDEEFVTIKEKSLIIPAETYYFFREKTLQGCLMANKSSRDKCSHNMKTLDNAVQTLWNFGKDTNK